MDINDLQQALDDGYTFVNVEQDGHMMIMGIPLTNAFTPPNPEDAQTSLDVILDFLSWAFTYDGTPEEFHAAFTKRAQFLMIAVGGLLQQPE